MWGELGISGGTAIIILIAFYFIIKWAVRNGIREAYEEIIGKRREEFIGKGLEDDWDNFLGEEEEENKGAKE